MLQRPKACVREARTAPPRAQLCKIGCCKITYHRNVTQRSGVLLPHSDFYQQMDEKSIYLLQNSDVIIQLDSRSSIFRTPPV